MKRIMFASLVVAVLAAASALPVPAYAETVPPVAAAAPVNAQQADDFDVYDDYYAGTQISDPLEGFNRGVYKFNLFFDKMLLRPIAKGYVTVVPEFGRDRVHCFLTNLGEPVNMLNGFLQGNPEYGFTSMWRFLINTTLGVGGLFDFAGYNFGLTEKDEDFGQTMGRYGVGSGPYIMIPFLGPSSGRDVLGRIVDAFTNPFNYVDEDGYIYARVVADAVDSRSRNMELLEDIERGSVDPYATIRSSWTQYRAAQVRNNAVQGPNVGY